ncbi:MAG TPA: metallopeptidase family protein [Lacipirellulaceae bacterium]|jgi:predicted Zn-dependent protease with MMP-like domain|nr:metallopeptidase family protein [Lacipirellulaceae bacterium]
MNQELRDLFDGQVEAVVAELPQQVRDFMKEVPLVVEDYPSREVMQRMKIRHPAHLYGLYTGIPLIKRSVDNWGVPSDVVTIYRLGIFSKSRARDGGFDELELRNQIRRTILHEYGHHVGLTERDLRDLGYG